MKRIIFPLLSGALIVASWTQPTIAQDDPIVTITPEAEPSILSDGEGEAGVVHDGTVSSEGGAMGIDNTIRHADAKRVRGWRHMLCEVHKHEHPHPIYAHSRGGANATWTHSWNEQQAMARPWHGGYYHYQYGAPLALVVPPTAAFQTNYSWGVGRTTSTPIYHQYARPYPGYPSGQAHGLHRTPYWPSNTNQFGVYPIRGPW